MRTFKKPAPVVSQHHPHPGEVAERVAQWSHQVLNYTSPGLNPGTSRELRAGDVRKLCAGNMMHVWSFMLAHVFSETKVDVVRKNLRLHGKNVQHSEDIHAREDMLQRMSDMKQRLLNMRKEIGLIDYDTSQIRQEMLETEQKTRVARRRAEESAQNEVLLSTYDEKCQFYTAMIHEYRNQLEEVIARSLKIPQQQQQQQYHDDDFNMHLDGENVILDREHMESETLQKIRSACQQLQNMYQREITTADQRMYLPENPRLDSTAMDVLEHDSDCMDEEMEREKLEQQIIEQLEEDSATPRVLFESLSIQTARATDELVEETNAITFKKDADEIRKRFQKQVDRVKNVGMLIADRRNEHIQQYLQTERYLNQMSELKRTTEAVLYKQNEQDEILLMGADDSTKHRVFKLRQLRQMERRIEMYKITASTVQSRLENLAEVRDRLKKKALSLDIKMKKLKTYEQRNRMKRQVIQNFIMENMKTRKSFAQRQQSITTLIQTLMSSFEAAIPRIISQLDGIVLKELDAVSKIELGALAHCTSLNDTEPLRQRKDLSIYRMGGHSLGQTDNLMRTLLRAAGFSTFKSSDALVLHAMQLRRMADDLEYYREFKNRNLTRASSMHIHQQNSIQRIHDLMQQATDLEAEQLKQWLPLVVTTVEECTSGIEECEDVERIGTEWLKQPAQHLLQVFYRCGSRSGGGNRIRGGPLHSRESLNSSFASNLQTTPDSSLLNSSFNISSFNNSSHLHSSFISSKRR